MGIYGRNTVKRYTLHTKVKDIKLLNFLCTSYMRARIAYINYTKS